MIMDQREKIDIFLQIVNATEAHEHVRSMYEIIMNYDASERVDRDFAYNCLIQYFTDCEEYEKCAALLKKKNSPPKSKRYMAKDITPEMLADMLFLGYKFSDSLIDKILNRYKD